MAAGRMEHATDPQGVLKRMSAFSGLPCDLAISSFITVEAQMGCNAGQTEHEDRRGFRCCYVP
jgi:hypothetical protein